MAITRDQPNQRSRFEHPALLGATLFFLTVMLYWEARYYQFVGLDDHVYVWNNPYVINGLSWQGIKYVFTNSVFSTYHPLTWLSLMADSTIFGLTPQGYHRTSITIHAVNAVLVFLILRTATGAALPSAFVAAIFAVHPLNVEPVAWISSRKDVLSGFFFLLGLWAHCAIPTTRKYLRTALVTAAYAFSLLAKPSVITFPLLLMLLDYWPLARYGTPPALQWKTILRLTVEKAPLFLILLISLITTSQSVDNSLEANDAISLINRMQDTAVNYAIYVGKCFAPIGLSAIYPYDLRGWSALTVAGSTALLIGMTAIAWFTRRRHSFIAVGWLWYLGVLFPMSGIIIVGTHNRADRYMYLPIIGVLIVISWGCCIAAKRINLPTALLRTAAILVVIGYTIAAWRELPNWENEKALATKVLDAHDWNPMGHYLMGYALEGEGDIAGALKSYQEQLRLVPLDPIPHVAIGNIQMKLARYDNAAFWYDKAVELSPNSALPLFALAELELQRGNLPQARKLLERCLQIQPYHEAARQALSELNAR